MNKPFIPKSPYILVHWSDLETAWSMLASPSKLRHVQETLQTVRALSEAGNQKAIFTMIAATAWLTDDGQGSEETSPFSASHDGSA